MCGIVIQRASPRRILERDDEDDLECLSLGLKCVFVISLHYHVVVIVVALLFLQIELGLGHALVRAALASRGDEPLRGDDAED